MGLKKVVKKLIVALPANLLPVRIEQLHISFS